ncbi:methionyl-tRNA formyltransferase [Candidatus Peregrinibacteria bacterium]|nr:MAG: methionyl-tRNA formyltransferase [Candidatus Peregrinibacteria bacterium]
MKKIKIVFAGTPQISVSSLQVLATDERFEVCAVVTGRDKKIGRKQVLTANPVKVCAEKNNVKIYQPEKMKELFSIFEDLKADILVVIAYGEIIPQSVLDCFRFQVNAHGSLLPKYRGASPIQEAVLQGEKETGISFMQMVKKMDAGGVYKKCLTPIMQNTTSADLFKTLSQVSADNIADTLVSIEAGKLLPVEQNESEVTYCSMIQKQDGEVDFATMTAQEIFLKMKAYTPWPGIFFMKDDKRIIIKGGEVSTTQGMQTIDGYFLPYDVIVEGKKTQPFLEWQKNI